MITTIDVHPYESPRGDRHPDGPCAVCGLRYGAIGHELADRARGL